MDWGKKIALAYGAFVVLMLVLVYACFKQKDIFLVSDDYYQQEISYQDRIDKIVNANSLSDEISITQNEVSNKLIINLTKTFVGATGTITFFRPSNPKYDVSFPINISEDGTQEVPTAKLRRGLWLVKIEWQKGPKGYYSEQKIQI